MLSGFDQDLDGWARAAAVVGESWVLIVRVRLADSVVVGQSDSVLGDNHHAVVGGHDLTVAVHAELIERLPHVATVQGSVIVGVVGYDGLIQTVMVMVARGCKPNLFLGHHEDAVVEASRCSHRLGAR